MKNNAAINCGCTVDDGVSCVNRDDRGCNAMLRPLIHRGAVVTSICSCYKSEKHSDASSCIRLTGKNKPMLRLLLVVIVSLMLQCLSSVSAEVLRAGYSTKSILSLHFFVAEKKGFFAAENLNVELIHMGSSTINHRGKAG